MHSLRRAIMQVIDSKGSSISETFHTILEGIFSVKHVLDTIMGIIMKGIGIDPAGPFHAAFQRLFLTGRVHVAMLVFAFALAPFGGLVVWPLWNWLIPDIFGLQELSYLQAGGLFALGSILFRSAWFPATWLPSASK
jgi:hypothetical protein